MKINDALRTKLNLIVVSAVAFAAGLGLAAELDLIAPSVAAGGQESAVVEIGTGEAVENTSSARTLSRDFARIAEHVTPAVVTVQVQKQVRGQGPHRFRFPFPFDPFGREPQGEEQEPDTRPATGSGFIIREDGYIVTNNHVVEGAEEIVVQLSDRREFRDVEMVGRDPTTDVALLKVDGGDLPAAPLGSSDSTRVGEWVLAVGNPGLGGPEDILPTTVTAGIVSGKGRSIGVLDRQFRGEGPSPAIEDFIQTDAAINPGNSGGPLVNMRGQVIGVNTAIASETGYYIGYGFAVPIELVKEVVSDLIQYGEVRRAVLGVTIRPVSAEDAEFYGLEKVGGAVVTGFSDLSGERTSPAKDAGVRAGDVIVGVEGERVLSVSDLQRRIRSYDPGEAIRVGLVRRSTKEKETVTVTLTEMEPGRTSERREEEQVDRGGLLGVRVRELDREMRARLDLPEDVDGVVVDGVARGGPAARAGIRPGAVILDVNGRQVQSVEDYQQAVEGLSPGGVANLRVYLPRSGTQQFLSIRIPEGR